MNILIFQGLTVAPTRGGISRMSQVYCEMLRTYGHTVYFLSVDKGDREPLENQLYLIGDTSTDRQQSFDRIVDEYGIKLLLFQDGISPYNNYVLRWAKQRAVKTICVIHSTLRGMYGVNGHPSLANIPLLNRIANKLLNYYFIRKYRSLYREEFELSDRVILLSDRFREEITYFTGWRDFEKFVSISNPLTIEAVDKVGNKQKTVLHVGLLSYPKRQDLLLKIWKIIEAKRPDWELHIAGDGPLRQKLVDQAVGLGLRRVRFLGFQSPEALYEQASIFCLTSGFESFGLVLVEAMAFGCVPIAFNSFETAVDIIDDQDNGFLIPPFELHAYADKIMWLMDNEAARNAMTVKAIDKSKLFDKSNIAPLWEKLINELCDC